MPPVIPGNDLEEHSVGEMIGGFMAGMAKGAFIGGILMGRFGGWGMAAGIIVGGYIGGKHAVEKYNDNQRIQMEEEFERIFRDPMRDALLREAGKGGLGARVNVADLSKNFSQRLAAGQFMTKSRCTTWCKVVGIAGTANRDHAYQDMYAKGYKLCHHWNACRTAADATKTKVG